MNKTDQEIGIEELVDFLNSWSSKFIDKNLSFDEVFNIEGIPLWWFYKLLLIRGELPGFDSLIKINKDINNEGEISLQKKIKYQLSSFVYRKFLSINERIKKVIAIKNKPDEGSHLKRILFLTFTNHIQDQKLKKIHILTDLLKKIRSDGQLEESILAFDPLSRLSIKKLRSVKALPYSHIKDINEKEIRKKADQLSQKWNNLDEEVKNNLFRYKDKNVFPHIKYQLNLVFSYELIYLVSLYYELIKDIIKTKKIQLVFLTGNGTLIERCALAAANNTNKDSLFSPHGTLSEATDYPFFKKAKFAVFGKEEKRMLIRKGIIKENIKITGPLVFDNLSEYLKNGNKLKSTKKKIILFATQAAVEKNMINKKDYFGNIKNYLKTLDKIRDISIVIKLHPAEKYVGEYKKIIQSLNNKDVSIIQGKERSIYELINKSDILVTFKTSVLFIAMALHKPIIKIDLFDHHTIPSIDEKEASQAILQIGHKTDFSTILKKILFDEAIQKKILNKQDEFIKNYFYKMDGKAYERVFEYICQIIRD